MTPLVRPEDATPAWVRAALVEAGIDVPEGAIAAIAHEPLGVGRGNLGGIVRLVLHRAEGAPDTIPATLVLKLAPEDVLPLVRSWRLGRRETAFYRNMGGVGPMRMPRCYAAICDDRTGDFTLLLEDLGAAEAADQGVGATEAQARIAVEKLARFHADFWASTSLEAHDWLHLPNANRAAFTFFVERAWRTCATRYPDLPTSTADAIAALKATYGECLDRMSSPPITLLHGDFRLDNMFFRSSRWDEDFAVVDWQLVCRGRGPWDLGHFLAGSLTAERRAALSASLVRDYHAIVAQAAGGGYSLEQCAADVDAGAIGSFAIAAVLVDMQVRSSGAPQPVMETWLRRSSAAASEGLARIGREKT